MAISRWFCRFCDVGKTWWRNCYAVVPICVGRMRCSCALYVYLLLVESPTCQSNVRWDEIKGVCVSSPPLGLYKKIIIRLLFGSYSDPHSWHLVLFLLWLRVLLQQSQYCNDLQHSEILSTAEYLQLLAPFASLLVLFDAFNYKNLKQKAIWSFTKN